MDDGWRLWVTVEEVDKVDGDWECGRLAGGWNWEPESRFTPQFLCARRQYC